MLIVSGGHPPNGGAVGIINETTENRKVVKEMVKIDASIKDVSCNFSMSENDELVYKVQKVNTTGNPRENIYADIHFNKVKDPNAHGCEVFILPFESGLYASRQSYEDNKKIAQDVLNKICEKTGLANRGVKEKDWYVLRMTNCHSILVEVCFIQNQGDVNKYNPGIVAQAIYEGCTGKTVTIAPPSNVVLNLDEPNNTTIDSDKLKVRGWCLGSNKVKVIIDNVHHVATLDTGKAREDVYNAYPQYNNRNGGFEGTVTIPGIGNGTHTCIIECNGVKSKKGFTVKLKEEHCKCCKDNEKKINDIKNIVK